MNAEYRIIAVQRGPNDWLYYPQFRGYLSQMAGSIAKAVEQIDVWHSIQCGQDQDRIYYCFNKAEDAKKRISSHKTNNHKSMTYHINKVI